MNLQSANGTKIKVHGFRTIYFKMPDSKSQPTGITFVVCDINDAIISHTQMALAQANLASGRNRLTLGNGITLQLYHEGQHLFVRPHSFDYAPMTGGSSHIIPMMKYVNEPLILAAAGCEVSGQPIRRTPGGNQDHWDLFREASIIRRVHKLPRKFLFVPQESTLPIGFTLDTLDQLTDAQPFTRRAEVNSSSAMNSRAWTDVNDQLVTSTLTRNGQASQNSF